MSTRTSKRASALLLKKDALLKPKLIGYWVATAAFALEMLIAATGELFLSSPDHEIVQIRIHEGYPAYLLTILGVWKLLGIIALLVPGFPRLKEWAYAGFFFDLTGAAVSGIVSGGAGDPGTTILFPIILTVIALASWALRPSSRTLGVLFPRRQLA
ncbi:MAG TPA: DoxX family protein [Ktedonobacteraceae bacterium]